MLRSIFFTIYGFSIGLGYAAAIWISAGDEPNGAGFWCVVVIAISSLIGWATAADPEGLNVQKWLGVTFWPLIFVCAFVYSMALMAFLLLLWFPWTWLSEGVILKKRARQLKNLMATQGRVIELADLRPRLAVGEGTLIWETGCRDHFVWWTADNIFALGTPPATEGDFFQIFDDELSHPFNKECVSRYLAEDGGTALLTSIPARYAHSGKLARMFPQMGIAMLVNVNDGLSNDAPDQTNATNGQGRGIHH